MPACSNFQCSLGSAAYIKQKIYMYCDRYDYYDIKISKNFKLDYFLVLLLKIHELQNYAPFCAVVLRGLHYQTLLFNLEKQSRYTDCSLYFLLFSRICCT